jgi:hypothetical protein
MLRQRRRIIKVVEIEDNRCDYFCSFSFTTFSFSVITVSPTILRKERPLVVKVFLIGKNLPLTGS